MIVIMRQVTIVWIAKNLLGTLLRKCALLDTERQGIQHAGIYREKAPSQKKIVLHFVFNKSLMVIQATLKTTVSLNSLAGAQQVSEVSVMIKQEEM